MKIEIHHYHHLVCECSHDPKGHTLISVLKVIGKGGCHMSRKDISPAFEIHSSYNYAILGITGPKYPNPNTGGFTYAGPGSWSFVNDPESPDALGIEQLPSDIVRDADGVPILDPEGNEIPVHKVKVLTPLTEEQVDALPGKRAGGVVTWKSSGMADNEIQVHYFDPELGHSIITGSEFAEEV